MSTFGPFIFTFPDFISNLGDLTSIPGISPFISKSGTVVFGPFILIFPDGILISGLFILTSIFLSVSIFGPFIFKLGSIPGIFPSIFVSGNLTFIFPSIFSFFPKIIPVIFSLISGPVIFIFVSFAFGKFKSAFNSGLSIFGTLISPFKSRFASTFGLSILISGISPFKFLFILTSNLLDPFIS